MPLPTPESPHRPHRIRSPRVVFSNQPNGVMSCALGGRHWGRAVFRRSRWLPPAQGPAAASRVSQCLSFLTSHDHSRGPRVTLACAPQRSPVMTLLKLHAFDMWDPHQEPLMASARVGGVQPKCKPTLFFWGLGRRDGNNQQLTFTVAD